MIYLIGIIDLDSIHDEKSQRKLIQKLYKAYLGNKTINERKDAIELVITKWEQKNKISINRRQKHQY